MASSKKKAVVPENVANPEAEVFGDAAREPMPVQQDNSHDAYVGVSDQVPPETEVPAEGAIPAPEVPVTEGPMPTREITEDELFGGAAGPEARGTGEQMVQVPMSVLEQMQRDIADLRSKDTANIVDPLQTGPRVKHISATFYTDDEGKQWLVTDMMERVFPNGDRAKVYQDGVDQNKNPIYKAILKVTNVETGEEKNVEVIYENFIKLSTPMKVEAVKTHEETVDMTPMEEAVEIATYQENGNYIRRVGTGVMVRTSVQGKIQRFDIVLNGKTYQLSSDVVNIK